MTNKPKKKVQLWSPDLLLGHDSREASAPRKCHAPIHYRSIESLITVQPFSPLALILAPDPSNIVPQFPESSIIIRSFQDSIQLLPRLYSVLVKVVDKLILVESEHFFGDALKMLSRRFSVNAVFFEPCEP